MRKCGPQKVNKKLPKCFVNNWWLISSSITQGHNYKVFCHPLTFYLMRLMGVHYLLMISIESIIIISMHFTYKKVYLNVCELQFLIALTSIGRVSNKFTLVCPRLLFKLFFVVSLFKWAILSLFCVYFQSFSNHQGKFYYKLMWKMSIQYLVAGSELTTFWLWVSSYNH